MLGNDGGTELRLGLGQLTLAGPDADAELLGDLGVAQLLQVVEAEDGAVAGGEVSDEGAQLRPRQAAHLLVEARRVVALLRQVIRTQQVWPLAQALEDDVDNYPPDPAAERPRPPVLSDGTEYPEEPVVDEVLGLGGVGGVAEGHAVQGQALGGVQLALRVPLPPGAGPGERQIPT